MDSFNKINNIFKDSFIVPLKDIISIDIITLLYPFIVMLRSIFIKVSLKGSLIFILLGIILIVVSLWLKFNLRIKNKFNFNMYKKIYNNNPYIILEEYINSSISNFSYNSMIIFHIIVYIEIYVLVFIINKNTFQYIIPMIFSIMGSIVLYITAIGSNIDSIQNKLKKLKDVEILK